MSSARARAAARCWATLISRPAKTRPSTFPTPPLQPLASARSRASVYEELAVCPRLSTANCARSRREKIFEDILAIHSGERLFTNFTVHQPAGGLGLCLYTHHLVVRATFRALEISGDVSGGHLFTQFERASEPGPPRHPPASIGGRARMPGTAGVEQRAARFRK